MKLCEWCETKPVAHAGAIYCTKKCRQTAFRLRKRQTLEPNQRVTQGAAIPTGATFYFLDPPYIGLSARYYRKEASFAGEVDHPKLIAETLAAKPAGWALCCSMKSLGYLLNVCHELGADVTPHPWVKPIGVPPATFGPHNAHEYVIRCGGRECRPGIRDFLIAQPARGGGTLPGRKPIAFCAWLFDLLGMVPGDKLIDVFPGSGIVGRAWRELSPSIGQMNLLHQRHTNAEASLLQRDDAE